MFDTNIYHNGECGKVLSTLYDRGNIYYKIIFSKQVVIYKKEDIDRRIENGEIKVNSEICEARK